MSYNFKNALIRKLNKNIIKAISSQNFIPSFKKIEVCINLYKKLLENAGLKVSVLESLEDFPDSIFVEDPGIIFDKNFISLRPGNITRFGESKILLNNIKNLFSNTFEVEKGFIEGGDVLCINNHFIIGLSSRTNRIGAEGLQNILNELGATSEITHTPNGVLHFKSECSILDNETILLTKKMMKNIKLKKKYNYIEVFDGEELCSNSLRINKNLLIASNCPKTSEKLSKKYNLIPIDIYEISKLDAGLSCMSLRW